MNSKTVQAYNEVVEAFYEMMRDEVGDDATIIYELDREFPYHHGQLVTITGYVDGIRPASTSKNDNRWMRFTVVESPERSHVVYSFGDPSNRWNVPDILSKRLYTGMPVKVLAEARESVEAALPWKYLSVQKLIREGEDVLIKKDEPARIYQRPTAPTPGTIRRRLRELWPEVEKLQERRHQSLLQETLAA